MILNKTAILEEQSPLNPWTKDQGKELILASKTKSVETIELRNTSCKQSVLTELIDLLASECPFPSNGSLTELVFYRVELLNKGAQLDPPTLSKLAKHCHGLEKLECGKLSGLCAEARLQISNFLIEILQNSPPLKTFILDDFSIKDCEGVEEMLQCLLDSQIDTLEEFNVSWNEAWKANETIQALVMAITAKQKNLTQFIQ